MVHIKNKQKQNLKESGTLELAKMLRSWLKRQSEECSLTAFSAWTLDLIWSKRRSVCVCVCVREREKERKRERERETKSETPIIWRLDTASGYLLVFTLLSSSCWHTSSTCPCISCLLLHTVLEDHLLSCPWFQHSHICWWHQNLYLIFTALLSFRFVSQWLCGCRPKVSLRLVKLSI